MLRKYSSSREPGDNLKLGAMTAISAGMVNVSSLALFFSFTSNVTGHYAILADDLANGRFMQAYIALAWIALFFMGSFLSNYIVIQSHSRKLNRFVSNSIPLVMEIIILLGIGCYGMFYYSETLFETEILVGLLLFCMGLQNGLTATVSNFAVKTTHLTGLTTDLAIYVSMFASRRHRRNPVIKEKLRLLSTVLLSYLTGGTIAGVVIHFFQFKVFPVIALFMSGIILYDYVKIKNEKRNAKRYMVYIPVQRAEA